MGLGFGIVMLVLGVILATGVGDWATPFVPEAALGWLLIVGGVVAVLASFMVSERQPPSPAPRRHHD